MSEDAALERPQVLVADDEPNLRRVLSAQLRRDGYDVLAVANGAEAQARLLEHHVDVIISDLRMPEMDGMALLRHVGEAHPDVPVILITAHGTIDTAVEALKLGAFDFVTKPFDRDELQAVVRKAARSRDLDAVHATPAAVASDALGRHGIIGVSPPMQEVYGLIERVADTPSTVLITGESGTGKELVAKALHEHSARRAAPFIRVNCAAIPAELLESELFGYERGAFTGAATSKPGRFELADGGTLFLDEIAEIPPSMQVKLLRALQEQEFERVGGIKTLRVDVRFVAATNRDLPAEIEAGRFREDLYYRLHVVNVALPPLRERATDIPLLLDHFVARFSARLGREVQGFEPEVVAHLSRAPWRGNIRELENVVERCMLFVDGPRIGMEHLPPELQVRTSGVERVDMGAVADALDASAGLKDVVRQATSRLEKELIVRALAQTEGNVTRAAKLLKISRKSLQTKMKELGLRDES